MQNAEGGNQTVFKEFILLGFGDVGELQPLLFLVFLLIYTMTVAWNIIIIGLVVADGHLHTPMYYLLGNFSFMEICYTTTLLPRLLASLVTGDKTISVHNCILQLCFFVIFSSVESLLLTAMSLDRYLAICHPLRYSALMNGRICCLLVVGFWTTSIVGCSLGTLSWRGLTFCGSNEIDHFFCDNASRIKLTCGDTRVRPLFAFIIAVIGSVVPFLLNLTSYVCIIAVILKIPSATGRKKTFSTCSSHLTVLTIYYGTTMIVYVVPAANTLKVPDKIISVFYSVLTPMFNPVIYSLRNKEVKKSMQKAVLQVLALRNRL
ncbi:olfactory receptor 5V1-like [Pelodiscus sinensis]|uniref:olfactory receptor 5V1-like n=1 Tax=Pelodiscus sinensis TaxID=13735 RepID=UPI003F6B053D